VTLFLLEDLIKVADFGSSARSSTLGTEYTSAQLASPPGSSPGSSPGSPTEGVDGMRGMRGTPYFMAPEA